MKYQIRFIDNNAEYDYADDLARRGQVRDMNGDWMEHLDFEEVTDYISAEKEGVPAEQTFVMTASQPEEFVQIGYLLDMLDAQEVEYELAQQA
jgi:hypothetical protein